MQEKHRNTCNHSGNLNLNLKNVTVVIAILTHMFSLKCIQPALQMTRKAHPSKSSNQSII